MLRIGIEGRTSTIKNCNIINNQQKQNENGLIYCGTDTIISDSCILNNAGYPIFSSANNCIITLKNCSIDSSYLYGSKTSGSIRTTYPIIINTNSMFMNTFQFTKYDYYCYTYTDIAGRLTPYTHIPTTLKTPFITTTLKPLFITKRRKKKKLFVSIYM